MARYRKSFEAKLIQSQSHIKKYYSAIKNALLSYKGTKSRVSWTADSFHNGRAQIAKINVKTRILELYLALDPATLDGTVYRGQDVGALRKYEETPFRYKIRTPRKFNWALELVHRVCEEHGLSPIDAPRVNYAKQYPFDTIENLVERKLVKVTTRLEKPAASFELDEEQPAVRAEEKETAASANANLSWKYYDENETMAEAEQLSVDMFLSEDAETPAEPENEVEPEPDTVRITQIRYTERFDGDGEPVSVTERIVTDAPEGAVVDDLPTEEDEPEAEAAFAEIAEGEPTEEGDDPLAAAFGEAHPENLWSEETSEREADRMNREGDFAPDEEENPAPVYREKEPEQQEYTEESLSAEDYREDETGLGNLYVPDEEEPSLTDEADGWEFAEDNAPEEGAPEEEEPEESLAREEPSYADPHYEEVRIEDFRNENESRAESVEPRPAEPAPGERPSFYAPAYEEPVRVERQPDFAPPSYGEQKPVYGQPDRSEQPPAYAPPRQEEPPRAQQAPAQPPKKKQIDPNLAIVDVALLDINFEDGDVVNLDILRRRGLVLPTATKLKVRSGSGKMRHALTVVANQFTYDALLAIGGAGGETQFIR